MHQRQRLVTNLDNQYMNENRFDDILNDEFVNCMEILIAESIGEISKSCLPECQRLSSMSYYSSLNAQQIRKVVIENITSNDVQIRIRDKVYKQLEIVFKYQLTKANSITQAAAKLYVENAVQQSVHTIHTKLLESIDPENQTKNIIIQRFILDNNRLKVV